VTKFSLTGKQRVSVKVPTGFLAKSSSSVGMDADASGEMETVADE
jgi:hypothetical protein